MYAGRHMHLEVELVKWLALLALASALALAAATRVAGQSVASPAEPGSLPVGIGEWSKPMTDPVMDRPDTLARHEESLEVWRLLELHRTGRPQEAKFGWQGHQLPCEQEVWRWVALGVAHMQLGEMGRAEEAWSAAEQLHPHHPLVHYYRGLAWLMRGDPSIEWYDRVDRGRMRLVSHAPRQPMPLPKGMCDLAAMTELARSIDRAGVVDLDAPLVEGQGIESHVDSDWAVKAPTVADLLMALGADNFAGRAHNLLGRMCLDRWMLERAEHHMDEAVASGLSVLDGYGDLGAGYEAEARYQEAARAYLKAMAHGGKSVVWPGRKALENFGKTLIQDR